MHALKIFLLAAYLFIACINLIDGEEYQPRIKQSQDRPFVMASRYGRSPNKMASGKQLVLTPRLDKFFLSSRYGKRSPAVMTTKQNFGESTFLPLTENLSCSYTGYSNLYRCEQKLEITDADFSSQQ